MCLCVSTLYIQASHGGEGKPRSCCCSFLGESFRNVLWLQLLTQFPAEGLNHVPSGCRLRSWCYFCIKAGPLHGATDLPVWRVPADPSRKGISQERTGRKGWQCWGCSQGQGQSQSPSSLPALSVGWGGEQEQKSGSLINVPKHWH